MQAVILHCKSNRDLPNRVLTFEDRAMAEGLLLAAGFERYGTDPNRWFLVANLHYETREGFKQPVLCGDRWDAEFVEIAPLTAEEIPREGVPTADCVDKETHANQR